MRFEVNVTADLDALHKAREAWNAAHQEAPAADMPSFVQCLIDQATANALNALPQPSTLSAALAKIAALEQEKADLQKDVEAALTPAPASQAPAPCSVGTPLVADGNSAITRVDRREAGPIP